MRVDVISRVGYRIGFVKYSHFRCKAHNLGIEIYMDGSSVSQLEVGTGIYDAGDDDLENIFVKFFFTTDVREIPTFVSLQEIVDAAEDQYAALCKENGYVEFT